MFKHPLQYPKKPIFLRKLHTCKKNSIWTQHDFLKFFCNVPICCYFGGTQFNQVQNYLDGKQSSFSPQSHMQQVKK